ncbi:DUF488 domain-containing protein [Horticoccus luteus]|uniref:DUF488 domain-containing protein n=1 Tax=Horticoccus luteus TaxID=2862869 RepID=A0A8F9XFZ5_9BACT|nr:DUF488 domain-containing protein [Horticoccus luteus]QYM78607.1 DUF488 domain-containing protein [Horticoccus luteus]
MDPVTVRPDVYTIGHSIRAIDEFISLLQAHGVTCLVDIRTVPRSRHNPQFNRDTLPLSLTEAHIGYRHCPALGGLRRTSADSVNKGWRNTSFRGYADYMQTPEFAAAISRLIELSKHDRLALMCAEAVPWRCHRSLVADALLVRGLSTADISSRTRCAPHRLTPFARVRGQQITYPPEAGSSEPTPQRKTKTSTSASPAPARKRKSGRTANGQIPKVGLTPLAAKKSAGSQRNRRSDTDQLP